MSLANANLDRFPPVLTYPRIVIAGLDPAIHLLRKKLIAKRMDPRVKPAGDAAVGGEPNQPEHAARRL